MEKSPLRFLNDYDLITMLNEEVPKSKDKLAKMRKKQREYTKFAKKLGVNRVSDLKKNEIKLKVDQILNMNK